LSNNIQLTQRLLEESKGSKLKRFVYASSSSVYGDKEGLLHEELNTQPKSPYGVTKLAAEHLCQLYHKEYRMPTVCLRLFSVYGPRQRPDMAFHRFCQNILRDAPLTFYGDGRQVRDFTYVEDVVEILASALTADAVGEVINVGGGSPTSLLDAVTVLEEISGKTSPKTFLERQKGDVFATRADTSKLVKFFGPKPMFSLKEGLSREWEWMKSFVQSEDDENALKAEVKIIVGVDDAVLAEAKADAKEGKKAKRKEEKQAKARAKAKKAEGPAPE
jgi:UDP-glucose 4-epimerase